MRSIVILSLVLAVSGCAQSSVDTAPAPAQSAVKHRFGQVSREELALHSGKKLGEAIRAIDPGVLASRGESLQVWVDGASFTVAAIETLSANDVQQVIRLSAADARQMFGERATGASIVVTTRNRSAR